MNPKLHISLEVKDLEQSLRFYSTLFDMKTMEPLISGPPFVKALEELGGGHLPTLVIDATGNAKSMSNAFNYIGHTGRMVYVGITPTEVGLPDPLFHTREMTLYAGVAVVMLNLMVDVCYAWLDPRIRYS